MNQGQLIEYLLILADVDKNLYLQNNLDENITEMNLGVKHVDSMQSFANSPLIVKGFSYFGLGIAFALGFIIWAGMTGFYIWGMYDLVKEDLWTPVNIFWFVFCFVLMIGTGWLFSLLWRIPKVFIEDLRDASRAKSAEEPKSISYVAAAEILTACETEELRRYKCKWRSIVG